MEVLQSESIRQILSFFLGTVAPYLGVMLFGFLIGGRLLLNEGAEKLLAIGVKPEEIPEKGTKTFTATIDFSYRNRKFVSFRAIPGTTREKTGDDIV